MVVGNYVYMDGEAHVRTSLACDVIMQSVLEERPGSALAFIGSPAMPVMSNEDINTAAASAWGACPWWHGPLSVSCGRFQRNTSPPVPCGEGQAYFTNGMLSLQGPNYCLAKSIQTWRAMVARAAGVVVSTNMAPPSRTDSVVHVASIATALNGYHYFAPNVVFNAETVSPMMALLLLFDLSEATKQHASSSHPEVALAHPMALFTAKAVHGGAWRCAYSANSCGTAAYVLGYTRPFPNDPTAPPPEAGRGC